MERTDLYPPGPEGVPADLTAALSAPLVNPTVYRLAGDIGWLAQATRHGALTDLWQRPFPSPTASS